MMDKRVVITGLGLETCLGDLSHSWHSILQGKTGIVMGQPFPEFPPLPLALLRESPSSLRPLIENTVSQAIAHGGLVAPLPDWGVVVGSSRSFQGQWEQFMAQRSPKISATWGEAWLASQPDQGAIAVARFLQTSGPVLAPMAACATGLWCVVEGYELLQRGACDRVMVGAAETPITPLTIASFQKMGAMAHSGCYPFSRDREGLVLGEGAGFLLLETEEAARARNAKIYGEVRGFGLTCDAHHLSSPDGDSAMAIAAVDRCLTMADLAPEEIDFIHCHGTSTPLNDQAEARVIQSRFPATIAVTATKGATGHTLGASGAIATVLNVQALNHGVLFPCVGLKNSPSNLQVITQAQPRDLRHSLVFGFGFGGQNVVLCVSRWEESGQI